MYSSCAVSLASRASIADKYSASGLLMAANEEAQAEVVNVSVLSISSWFAT